MELHAERAGTGPRLVLVHGFTQTARCWGPEAEDLARDHEVVRVDAPGHGRSAEVATDLETGGRRLLEAGGAGTYVGYSMGARLCLHAALGRPESVRGLVLLGGTAGIEDPDEREARRARDEELAARLERDGVGPFLEEWLAQPLFAGLPPARAFPAERSTNTAAGLASSLRLAGTGAQAPRWDDLHRLTMPVLLMAGDEDRKFTVLAQRMAERIGPRASVALVPGAGHAAHLEQPDGFLAALRPWLARHGL